jgi:carboxyl-terminal processing protease
VAPGSRIYSKPVVILIGGATASASEAFIAAMSDNGRAVLIGTASCGCANLVTGVTKLPDGGELRVSNLGGRSSKGVILDGKGVDPDFTVVPTLSDLRSGRDPVLEAAEKHLLSLKSDG